MCMYIYINDVRLGDGGGSRFPNTLLKGFGFSVQGSGFRIFGGWVLDLGLRVWSLAFRV